MQNCQLEYLSSYDPLQLLTQLKIKENQAAIDPAFFECCSGSGSSFVGDMQRLCSIKRRLSYAQTLLDQFQQSWQREFVVDPKAVTRTELAFLGNSIAKYKQDAELIGNAFCTYAKADQPSLKVWHWALAAVWCFDISVQVISLRGNNLQSFSEKPKVAPQIIFVEQKAPLSDIAAAYAFDAIVGWSYLYNFPLWIDVLNSERNVAGVQDSLNVREAYAYKIAQMEKKAPLAWLPEDTKSKLTELCKGVELYLS